MLNVVEKKMLNIEGNKLLETAKIPITKAIARRVFMTFPASLTD